MDPLSITASSIAILGTITGTSKGISKLVSLRDAPIELQALYNEVEAFRSLLVIIQSSLRHVQGSEAYEEYGQALCNLLTEAKQAVLELECTIEYQLRRGVEVDQNGLPKVSRMTWMRSAGKIEELRMKIKNSRGNLSTGLQAISLHISIDGYSSETTRKTAVQIQCISPVTPDSYHEKGSNRTSSETHLHSSNQAMDLLEQHTTASDANQPQTDPSLESCFQMVQHTPSTENPLIKVVTSVTTQQCARSCPCQCHIRSFVRSPTWLKAAFGQMLLSYHSLLRATPCDYPPCCKTPRKTEFTYYFPRWFAQRTLILLSESELSGRGASISLAMPVVITKKHPIWHAVENGNVPFIQQLFGQGFSPYVIDEDGQSLVLQAVKYYHAATVRFLIQQGAKTNWRSRDDFSPTALALVYDRVYSLHNYGWDPEEVAEDLSFSALHTALTIQSSTAKDFEMLLQQHFDLVNTCDRLKMTPLHWAARNGDSLAVKLLIQWNANIDARDRQQCTPLHEACVSGDLKSITLLRDAGADVNAENDEGQTPLFMFPNEPDGLVSLLVQRGSNIKHRDIYGWTVLHDAAHQGRSQVIHEYITHGADINAIDNWERTPVQRGIINNRFSAVSALLRSSKIHGGLIDLAAGSKSDNILHLTAPFAGVEIMRLLADEYLTGLDPTLKDEDNDTPNDCFILHRDRNCTIFREPFEIEQKAWHELLQSACRQNKIDFDSLGIVPSSTIEEVTTESDADSDDSNEDEDEDKDEDDEEGEEETFVDAPEEFNA